MPWILCGPGFSGSPARFCVSTGLAAGSTATETIGLPLVALDVARDAGDGAAGADAGDQHVDRAVGVVPDLRAGGLLVDRGIGGVLELLQQHVALGIGGRDLLGLGDRAAHALRRLR